MSEWMSADEICDIAEKIDALVSRLGLWRVNGKVASVNGAFLIDVHQDDTNSITSELIGEGALAVSDTAIIERDEMGIYDPGILEDERLVGAIKWIALHIRQRDTGTWFRIKFTTGAGIRLKEIIENYDETDPEDDGNDAPSITDDDISLVAATAASRGGFAHLRNKAERKAFVHSISGELGFSTIMDVWGLNSASDLAESCYELFILPRQCKEFSLSGMGIKAIAKETGKSAAKVEKALKTEAPEFVVEAMERLES